MKNKIMGMVLVSLISSMALASPAALTLSQTSFIAGKSIVVSLKDSSGVNVTSQYSLSYPGTELKITAFNGKPMFQGVVAGSGYDVVAKKIATNEVSDLFVSVTPATFYKLAIISGSNQTVTAGTQPAQPIVIQAQDLYKNGIAGETLAVTLPSGSESVITDAQGNAQIPYTAGMSVKTESIKIADGVSSVLVAEKVVAPADGVASVKLSGVPSKVDAGASFSVVANLTDSTGASVINPYPVTVTAYSNSSCTTVNSNIASQTINNTNGSLTFSGLSDSTLESFYIGAFAGGHGACSSVITVAPPLGEVSKLIFTQSPTSGKSGVSLFPPTMIQLQDSNSRIVTTSSDSVVVKSYSDSSCSSELPDSGNTASASAGKVTFGSLKITDVGSAYIKASDGGVSSACLGPIVLVSNTNPAPTPNPITVADSFPIIYADSVSGELVDSSKSNLSQIITASGGTGNYTYSVAEFTKLFNDSGDYSGQSKMTSVCASQGANGEYDQNIRVSSPGVSSIYLYVGIKCKIAPPPPLAPPVLSTVILSGPDSSNVSDALSISYDKGQSFSIIPLNWSIDSRYRPLWAASGSNVVVSTKNSSTGKRELYFSSFNGYGFSQVSLDFLNYFPQDLELSKIDVDGKKILLAGWSNSMHSNYLWLSKDYGASFSQLNAPLGNWPSFIQLVDAEISGNNILLFYTDTVASYYSTNQIYVSTNSGGSFNQINFPQMDNSMMILWNVGLRGSQIDIAMFYYNSDGNPGNYTQESLDMGATFTEIAQGTQDEIKSVNGDIAISQGSNFSISLDKGLTFNPLTLQKPYAPYVYAYPPQIK